MSCCPNSAKLSWISGSSAVRRPPERSLAATRRGDRREIGPGHALAGVDGEGVEGRHGKAPERVGSRVQGES